MAHAPPLVVPIDMCLGAVRRAGEVHQEKGLLPIRCPNTLEKFQEGDAINYIGVAKHEEI